MIVTTISPDHIMPATASIVADKIGATRAGAFDVQAGCTGFVYGLAIATAFVSANIYQNVLVLGAEVLSKMLDWEDRSTCVLFGDGAGAVLVQPTDNGSIFSFDLGNDGSGAPSLLVPAGGSRQPASFETVRTHEHTMHMTGSEVFKFATRTVVGSCQKVLDDAELTVEDVDLFVPHQANIRIIETAARRLGFTRGPGLRQPRPLRQHLVRVDPHLPARSQPERPAQEGRHAAHGRVRRGAHVGLVPDQMGAVTALTRGAGSPHSREPRAMNRFRVSTDSTPPHHVLEDVMSKLALMFPGQGSQAVGMGCDLCAAHPQMRDTYAEASDILDFDLEIVCAGPAEALARTDITQPALLANSIGIFRILAEEGLKFDAAFGHSLGEYSALVATGAVSFEDALRLVRTPRPRDACAPPRPSPAAWPPSSASATTRWTSCAPASTACGRPTSTAPARSSSAAGRPRWTTWPHRPPRPAPSASFRWP